MKILLGISLALNVLNFAFTFHTAELTAATNSFVDVSGPYYVGPALRSICNLQGGDMKRCEDAATKFEDEWRTGFWQTMEE